MAPGSDLPAFKHIVVTFPAEGVMLVRLNRPKQLNCLHAEAHVELIQIWDYLDSEDSLRVGIITGTGRAFCAGADLKGQSNCMLSSLTFATMTTMTFCLIDH